MPLRIAVPVLDDHPSSYVVRDFVSAVAREGVEAVQLHRGIGSLLARSGLSAPRRRRNFIIVPLMGARFDVLAASTLYGIPIPFCWDVWEPEWSSWAKAFRRTNPPLVITTARRSAQHLQAVLGGIRVEHLPEAIDIAKYSPGSPLRSRSIDVLELGRRHSRWHEAVKTAAQDTDVLHLYERVPGELVFADETTLSSGLAQSKISVCFPSDLTHPKRSGSVSTLTSRYLESMASRCLVLGESPPELGDLLGFDPVVGADMTQPWPQLNLILSRIETYQDQVDRAHRQVQSVGSWSFRIRQLLDLIQAL